MPTGRSAWALPGWHLIPHEIMLGLQAAVPGMEIINADDVVRSVMRTEVRE